MIPKLLEQLNKILANKNVIKNELAGLDGVKIEIWASSRQTKNEKSINKEITKINEKLQNGEEAISDKEKQTLNNCKIKLETRKIELQKLKEKEPDEKKREKMSINITSPGTARMQKRNGKWIQGKNIQSIINQDNIVNVYEATSSPNDYGYLGRMYDKFYQFLCVMILEIYLLVDGGYWKLNDIKRFDPAKGYKVIIPSPACLSKERNRKRGKKSKGYGADQFTYDEKNDYYKCKNDKKLVRKKDAQIGQLKRKIYRSSAHDCKNCGYRKD